MTSRFATRRHGNNWELAAPAIPRIQEFLDAAKEKVDHQCVANIRRETEGDGSIYANKIEVYYIDITGPSDTDSRLPQVFQNILDENQIFYGLFRASAESSDEESSS